MRDAAWSRLLHRGPKAYQTTDAMGEPTVLNHSMLEKYS